MKTPVLVAFGFALVALATALVLFSGIKAQEPASSGAQRSTPEQTTSSLDSPREAPKAAQEAPVDAQRQATGDRTSGTATEQCVLRVLDERGQSLGGVAVFAVETTESWQHGFTEADGRVSLGATGAVQLFAIADKRPVQRFELELSAGEREVVLDAPSASVAGVLTIRGAPPVERIKIALMANIQPFADLELPPRLQEDLARTVVRTVECAADGAFEAAGLAPEWSGRLLFSRGYVLAGVHADSDERYALALEHPRSDLRIELERLARIVGRFESASGEVVRTSEKACLTIFSEQGGRWSTVDASIDEFGRFSSVVHLTSVRSVEVRLDCDLGRGDRTAARSELTPTSDGDLDLGVIVLAPQNRVRLRTMSAGAPVAGAKARVTFDQKWSESDAEGRLDVRSLLTGDAHVVVIATDFWKRVVPVHLPLEEELIVELAPANVLTITVRDAAGAPVGGATVVFEARGEPLFSGSASMGGDELSLGLRRGERRGSRESRGDVFEGELEVIADDNGVVELQELSTQGRLTVKLVDALKQTLVSAPLEPFGLSERRDLELSLPSALKSLRGRVLDPDGRLVYDASVTVRVGDGNQATSRTNSAGRFSFEPVSVNELELKVESPHFAPHILPRVTLPDPTNELVIQLERGRVIVVEVVDESGAPIGADRVQASTPDGAHQWTADPQAPGRYRFQPLPIAPLKITAHAYLRTYALELGDREESARLVIPTPGRLTVRLATAVDMEQRVPLVSLRSLDGAAVASRWATTEAPLGPLDFGALAPGEYELVREDFWLTERSDAPGRHEVQHTLRVTIRSGETTDVELP